MAGSTRWYDAEQLRRISEVTIAHYDRLAEAYWDATRDHDVNQNYAALLDAIEGYFDFVTFRPARLRHSRLRCWTR